MQTTKPILTLSSLAGVETVDARDAKKKRKGTGTTIMNKRSNTLASVSSRVDDLAQQIGDFIKSQAAATPVLLSQVPSLPQVPLVSQGYQTTMPSLPQPAPPSQGYYVMPPPTPIVPVYVQAPAPSQWQEPPPSSQAHHDGFMWAQPPAQSHETATEHFQQLGDQRDTAPYKTSRQAGHKFVPYVPRPPPRRTDPSSQSQSQSQR
ncbi:hypothetical protein HRG_012491 [Hirsutella rhossiliensis]